MSAKSAVRTRFYRRYALVSAALTAVFLVSAWLGSLISMPVWAAVVMLAIVLVGATVNNRRTKRLVAGGNYGRRAAVTTTAASAGLMVLFGVVVGSVLSANLNALWVAAVMGFAVAVTAVRAVRSARSMANILEETGDKQAAMQAALQPTRRKPVLRDLGRRIAAVLKKHGRTIARAGVFWVFLQLSGAGVLITGVLTGTFETDAGRLVSILVALVAAALSLVADALLARRWGARGKSFGATVAQTALVWAYVGVVAFLFRSGSEMSSLLLAPVFLLALIGIALSGPSQALELWFCASTLLSLWMFPALIIVSGQAFQDPSVAAPVVLLWVVYLPLSFGSTAALSLYLRRIAASHGLRGSLSRLAFAAAAVGIAIVVAAGTVWWVSAESAMLRSAEQSPSPLASVVAHDLAGQFTAAELSDGTPEVITKLAKYGATANQGLTIVDWRARRIVVAVRDSGQIGEQGEALFRPATLPAAEVKSIMDWAVPNYDLSAAGTSSTRVFESAEIPAGGSTLALVVTDPDPGWSTLPPVTVGATAVQSVGVLFPWLLATLLLPTALALLANERADRSRAELLFAQERARLSRDAHDRIYNRMTALASRLESAPGGEGPDTPSAEIRGAVLDLQRILGDVDARAAAARDRGVSLLDDVVADQSRRYAMEVRLSGQGALAGIDPRLAWDLQCVVEEALTNAGRHGKATHATVVISKVDGALHITVTDDGSGVVLGPDGLPENAHGLKGMRERMAALGGTLELSTAASGGVVLEARVPISG